MPDITDCAITLHSVYMLITDKCDSLILSHRVDVQSQTTNIQSERRWIEWYKVAPMVLVVPFHHFAEQPPKQRDAQQNVLLSASNGLPSPPPPRRDGIGGIWKEIRR